MSVRTRERTFRRVEELEEDVAPRKEAAGHASRHGAVAGGCARVVVGRSGPSNAQLPLAGALPRGGAPPAVAEVTLQSPEKKEEAAPYQSKTENTSSRSRKKTPFFHLFGVNKRALG